MCASIYTCKQTEGQEKASLAIQSELQLSLECCYCGNTVQDE